MIPDILREAGDAKSPISALVHSYGDAKMRSESPVWFFSLEQDGTLLTAQANG